MAWTDGTDRATGYLVTASNWNDLLGASGSLMTLKSHAHGGTTGHGSTSIGPLTYASFGTNPSADGEVRLPNGGAVKARNAANDGQLPLVSISGNQVRLGGANSAGGGVTNVAIYDATGAAYEICLVRTADGSGHVAAAVDYWAAA